MISDKKSIRQYEGNNITRQPRGDTACNYSNSIQHCIVDSFLHTRVSDWGIENEAKRSEYSKTIQPDQHLWEFTSERGSVFIIKLITRYVVLLLKEISTTQWN